MGGPAKKGQEGGKVEHFRRGGPTSGPGGFFSRSSFAPTKIDRTSVGKSLDGGAGRGVPAKCKGLGERVWQD